MQRRIIGFHEDGDHQWVAELDCGHARHVRHLPPWQIRLWARTAQGRRQRIGTLLTCGVCAATGAHGGSGADRNG